MTMAFGPAAGLELVDALMSERSLQQYHLLPSVRGDLLHNSTAHTQAQVEFERATSITRISREVELLLARTRDCATNHVALMLIETFSTESKMKAGSVSIPSPKTHSDRQTLTHKLTHRERFLPSFSQRLGSPRLESKSLIILACLDCHGRGRGFESRRPRYSLQSSW
jgi:hypothetical protein